MTRRTIYKYPIAIAERQVVTMPEHSVMLTAMMQHGVLCLWAEVDVDAAPIDRVFWIVGTGHRVPDVLYLAYIKSVIDGQFVWHIYEENHMPIGSGASWRR